MELKDDSISLTALTFDTSKVKVVDEEISDFANALELVKTLAEKLPKDDLAHIFVLSDG